MAILKSKKFLVAIAGVLAALLSQYLSIPEETTMQVSGIVIAYIIGQGLADKGKEAEKIKKAE